VDHKKFLQLFKWTEIDEAMLRQLSCRSEGGGSLASKKYEDHVCCLSFSSCSIDDDSTGLVLKK
jgi:hypothetical protein